MSEYDASDYVIPSVTFKNIEEVWSYRPRPTWQRRLSWVVWKWRYPIRYRQIFSPLYNLMRDKILNAPQIETDENGMIRIVMVDDYRPDDE